MDGDEDISNEAMEYNMAFEYWKMQVRCDSSRIIVKCNVCGVICSKKAEGEEDMDCPDCEGEETLLPLKEEWENC